MYSIKRHIDLMLAQAEIFCSIIQMNTGLCCYLTRWLTPETLKMAPWQALCLRHR